MFRCIQFYFQMKLVLPKQAYSMLKMSTHRQNSARKIMNCMYACVCVCVSTPFQICLEESNILHVQDNVQGVIYRILETLEQNLEVLKINLNLYIC